MRALKGLQKHEEGTKCRCFPPSSRHPSSPTETQSQSRNFPVQTSDRIRRSELATLARVRILRRIRRRVEPTLRRSQGRRRPDGGGGAERSAAGSGGRPRFLATVGDEGLRCDEVSRGARNPPVKSPVPLAPKLREVFPFFNYPKRRRDLPLGPMR